ncbi:MULTISPECIES: ATP-binding protein [Pseudoalteromonas]|uniref:sensor histidine kinase n=1 Tax=Pseudoalteromonas TaxID=53246 RepID=UPI00055F53E0|nr:MULTISPECIES: ATP-binding protein [Pseudoalteromonas]MAY59755.1 two-component sensor histidine kinase [Pseudoalteromonas sp.]MDN3404441.1 ATP-binding protein [Pseudoalteromonas sp. APC 3218]MDN3408344.1 ATP-binding protein [Pseudoalteromonas sp. APC 3894]MDN3415984.1 ATP-binding protein [Pseudoalteromonas sp. APC 3227]MDN3419682.1 ATP-binding protein [Pseudoalteromonas sp. APC 3895]|tara:strand:+ start:859 stop:1809 length:951 start_codon:yes stop_codon:yes gene_type:complete
MAEDDYNYKKAYLREKSARDQLETLLEDKTRALFIVNQELEEKLETVKNQQITLMQSEKMATLGTLSAGMAHEINNPLAYITSNVESIKFIKPVLVSLMTAAQQFVDKSISVSQLESILVQLNQENDLSFIVDDIDDLVDDTQEGLERIAHIVNNLVDFASLKDNVTSMADITESLNSTLKLLDNQLGTCAIELHIEKLPLTRCNISSMKQVFVNLLINAKHACDDLRDQQGKIRVKLFANENNIYIEVADNGCGMDADTLKQMFDPFFTTKPVGQGTGMGMAIVYNVLKEHNGTIEVESEVGMGSLIRCVIPIAT